MTTDTVHDTSATSIPAWEGDITQIPYWVYRNEDVRKLEQEKIYQGPTWNYLCLEAEIPKAGDYRSTFVGEMPVVVTRNTDGGIHAFLLDTTVHPDYRRQGIATELVALVTSAARARGADWLHVDYEPHLAGFYRACGFRHTEAGLIAL